MKEHNEVNSIDLLQLMFIYLKLTSQIDWAWWQVLLPLIISGIIVLISLVIE